MADIYGFQSDSITTPITADRCTVQIAGTAVGSAVNVTIQYNQQINRRRVVGNQQVLLWSSSPQGQASIQTMVVGSGLKGSAGGSGWNGCSPATVTFVMNGCRGGGSTITCSGAVVSSYSVTAEVEGLTVMENVVMDFVPLS
jgi:hypothetical protein